MVVVDVSVHQFNHTLQRLLAFCEQMLLDHADIVEGIYLIRFLNPCKRLVFTSEFAQHHSLHGSGLVVMAVADECMLQLIDGFLPALVSDIDAGSLEIARIGPCFVPGGFHETVVGFTNFGQVLIGNTEIEQRLTIVGVGITLLLHLDGSLQETFCLSKTGTAQIPQTHLQVAAIVLRIAAQTFLVVVESTPSGMTVLLQMQTGEV